MKKLRQRLSRKRIRHLITIIFGMSLISAKTKKADKGNSIVLVNMADYTKRMKE